MPDTEKCAVLTCGYFRTPFYRYVVLTCDLGETLIALAATVVLYSTTFLLAMAAVKHAIDRYFHKITDPKPLPGQILKPLFGQVADFLRPLFVTEESAVRFVRSVYARIPAAQNAVLDIVYCTDLSKTAKVCGRACERAYTFEHTDGPIHTHAHNTHTHTHTHTATTDTINFHHAHPNFHRLPTSSLSQVLLASFVIRLVAWFSISTMILLAIVTFFTVPFAYKRHKVEVDRAIGSASDQARLLVDKLPPPIRAHLGMEGEAAKKKA